MIVQWVNINISGHHISRLKVVNISCISCQTFHLLCRQDKDKKLASFMGFSQEFATFVMH